MFGRYIQVLEKEMWFMFLYSCCRRKVVRKLLIEFHTRTQWIRRLLELVCRVLLHLSAVPPGQVISGWTTQPSVRSASCCCHGDSRCDLATRRLRTRIQPYQRFVVSENFGVTFPTLLRSSVAVSLRGDRELSSDLQRFEFCLAALTPPRSLRTGRRE